MIHEESILNLIDGVKMVIEELSAKSDDPNLSADELTEQYLSGIKLLRTNLSVLESEVNAIDTVWTKNAGLCYYIVVSEYGCKHFYDCKTRTQCREIADSYCGDNGFAYVYTTDKTYPKRGYDVGGTLYFNSIEEAHDAAKAEVFPKRY